MKIVSRWLVGMLVVGILWVGPAMAQEESSEDVITFGNDDAAKARPMNIFRVRSKGFTRVEATGEVDAENKEPGTEGDAEAEPEEEEDEVVDAFVVLAGNHRFHIDSCPLVASSKVPKQTLNGKAIIAGRYMSCSTCKPPAPMENPPPPKEKKDDSESADEAAVEKPSKGLNPQGRPEEPEPTPEETPEP